MSETKNIIDEINESDRLAITEAYRFYQLLDDDCKARIPDSFKNFLEQYKDVNLGEVIHLEIPLTMQNISQEGWNLIAYMGNYLK